MSKQTGDGMGQDMRSVREALKSLGPEGILAARRASGISNRKARYNFMISAGKEIAEKVDRLSRMKKEPVDIKTFVEGKQYMDMKDDIYPEIMKALVELNSGKYVEAVLTGGIGVGKTMTALLTTAYQLYILAMLKDPHREFNIAPSDEIVFVFQSVREQVAKALDYARFRNMIERSSWFSRNFRHDKSIESEMRFPSRIIVKPIASNDTAAIGQNVFGGVIDEINFLAVTEKSKLSVLGGLYDQAAENYNAIVRRRESRFMVRGTLPGMLCLVSSKRYPEEFTERKVNEARREEREKGFSRIFIFDKRIWEVKPEGTFSGDWFKVFVGDEGRKPRILEADEEVPEEDRDLVHEVPEEYRMSFETDILSAMRDILSVATLGVHPYISDPAPVRAAFTRRESVLTDEWCDFSSRHIAIRPRMIESPELPRFIHIDLALTRDSAGIACGFVPGFRDMERNMEDDETLPVVFLDFILEVRPPKNSEINIGKVRELIYKLQGTGMNVRWVSADQFQSRDTLQILKRRGFTVGERSMDRTSEPYDVLKMALYDGRVQAPPHDKCQNELVRLERDPKTGKIDHPSVSGASKDCSDAVAGVVFGLTMRREIWSMYNVMARVPASLVSMTSRTHEEEVRIQ